MTHEIFIQCTAEGVASSTIDVDVHSIDGKLETHPGITTGDPIYTNVNVQAIQVSVRGGAYWDIVFTDVSQSVAGTLPPVSRKDASWWRAVHLDGSTYSADRKMRVGVIDEGLVVEDPRLQHIANYGYDWNDDLQGLPARDSSHSYAVCSLLGARPESDDSAPAGVIPDAEILFCAAGGETRHPLAARFHGGRPTARLSVLCRRGEQGRKSGVSGTIRSMPRRRSRGS